MSAPRIPIEDRFWGKVQQSEGCWEWMGHKNSKGYGTIHVSGSRRYEMAHRVAFELANATKVAPGLVVDHLCHNPACVRPDHLRVATTKINGENRRGANRNSLTGIRGVTWQRRSGTWRVRVTHHGVTHEGGTFDTLEAADAAARALRKQLFGDGR